MDMLKKSLFKSIHFATIFFCIFCTSAFSSPTSPANPTPKTSSAIANPQNDNAKLSSNAFSVNSQQMGWSGPFSIGVSRDNLFNYSWNAQYIQKFSNNFALAGLLEYGSDMFRANGTVGFKLFSKGLLKLTAERLSQVLPFTFDTGNVNQRMAQNAFGARYQHVFNHSLIQDINFGGYYSHTPSRWLDPVYFMRDNQNMVNKRHIAGGTSRGLDVGTDLLLSKITGLTGHIYYDDVTYNKAFSTAYNYDKKGVGGEMGINQLLGKNLLLSAEGSVRKIYNTYKCSLSWLPSFAEKLPFEISLFAQRMVSHNQTPNDNSIGLKLSFNSNLLNGGKNVHYALPNHNAISDITTWTSTPAVRMEQVLAIADQSTTPAIITSIAASSGPTKGGTSIKITGAHLTGANAITFDGVPATSFTVTSPNTIQCVTPPHSAGKVNVLVATPNGEATGTFIYNDANDSPVITTSSLPDGKVGYFYRAPLEESGGKAPYTWNATGLPSGLTLDTSTSPVTISGTPATSGNFSVVVTLACIKQSVTETFALNITNNENFPEITTQPASQTVQVGQPATFTVVASGTGTLGYQWQKNGSDISGATSATYTINSVTAADNGSYMVSVSNGPETIRSTVATLTVVNPTSSLEITTTSLPDGQVGLPYNQTLAASGGTTPYSWSISAGNLPTGLTLARDTGVISGTPTASGTSSFTVTVDDSSYQIATSQQLSITITDQSAPVITVQPTAINFSYQAVGTTSAPQTVTVTNTGSVDVNFSSIVPSGDFAPINTSTCNTSTPLAAGASCTISVTFAPTTIGARTGTLTITDAAPGSSKTVVLTGIGSSPTPPVITHQPSNQSVSVGQTATFTVVASGAGTLSYQWQKNGSDISGATSASYTTTATSTSDSGSPFTVTVSNSAGSVLSTAATLTVNAPPVINTQPSNQSVSVGQTATFTVVASGTAPLSYQWQKNGSDISGATSATYTINSVTASDSGSYTVFVSNSAGNATSNAATLTMLYTITPTAGIGGSISPPMAQTVPSGGNVTFTIAPNSGYQISDISLDGQSTGELSSPYFLSNITQNHTIHVSFALKPTPPPSPSPTPVKPVVNPPAVIGNGAVVVVTEPEASAPAPAPSAALNIVVPGGEAEIDVSAMKGLPTQVNVGGVPAKIVSKGLNTIKIIVPKSVAAGKTDIVVSNAKQKITLPRMVSTTKAARPARHRS